MRIYETKASPSAADFVPTQAIQRVYGLRDAYQVGKPSAQSLTLICRILHHMISYILMPRGRHRDEVSYFELFLIDVILTGRRIHLGYIMMHYMTIYQEDKKRTLPYGRFLTRVFKDDGMDLSVFDT